MNEDLFEWLPSNKLDYQYQTYIKKIFSKHLSSQNFSYVVIIYLIVMAVVMYKLQKNLIVVIIPAVLFCLLFIRLNELIALKTFNVFLLKQFGV